MNNGRVYWITGVSNSGKTTIGTTLYYDLKKKGKNVVILDGDLLKNIASGSVLVGYAEKDRLNRAKRYSYISKMLADQGLWVIICTISMFNEVREWNRKNIKGYIEIFVDAPEDVLKERDRKGVYKPNPQIELPKSPDIHIFNDGKISIREHVRKIELLVPVNEDDYDRDRIYWNHYYKDIKDKAIAPSGFAIEVGKKLSKPSHIMEIGCGNGRDSLYFLSLGHNVIAIDGSDFAIDMLNEVTLNNENALFVCDDFVKCKALYQMQYDCIYSRFTLHAISDEQETELLNNALEALRSGGMLCIEARTIHDEIYGRGEKVGHNAYIYNDHYRRFIDVNEFEKKISDIGFKIEYLAEEQGFSKTSGSDPVLMRIIAKVDL